MIKTVVRLIALLAGVILGYWWPDFDQDTDALVHRSIVTHGLLVPLLLYVVLGSRRSPSWARIFAAGVALAVAVHLSFDLFPKDWTGFALIHLPKYGWLPTPVSPAWIAVSITVCFYIAIRSAQGWLETTFVLLGVLAVFRFSVPAEDAMWRPLAAALVGLAIALALASRKASAASRLT
jgi:hypothetical protein